MADRKVVVVTGASGLLGRAVAEAFSADPKYKVIGTAFSRAKGDLVKLDITSPSNVATFLTTHRPDAIIHCAAERRPDVAERDPSAAESLNVNAAGSLAAASRAHGAWFLYVSTDYVFDGTKPPYEVDDAPNPLQFYGRSKLGGERACLEKDPACAVLRVPVLYGSVTEPGESAVNVLVPTVLNRAKQVSMDDYQSRYPTNVLDVGEVMKRMYEKTLQGTPMTGIFHYSAKELFTKYGMCALYAELLGVTEINHLIPVRDAPKDAVGEPNSIRRIQCLKDKCSFQARQRAAVDA
ncbi:hypothetical protein HK101_004409 [Irineochytrium annulatum]|nr:hypothetical protein HK101_004409 [Irineochytrium annulatum]